MANMDVLDRDKVERLLFPNFRNQFTVFRFHDKEHSWRYSSPQLRDLPLLRLWDSMSGSQPDENGRMDSRALNEPLSTFESRARALQIHINHADWQPTPFISFTSSPTAVKALAQRRAQNGNRGAQTLTVIDPNTRERAGLPVLNMDKEMDHYKIRNPYGSGRYCDDHYICLWQVTGREVVGSWSWDELSADENWYGNIVMPAFREFKQRVQEQVGAFDLSALTAGLPCEYQLCANILDTNLESESPRVYEQPQQSGRKVHRLHWAMFFG